MNQTLAQNKKAYFDYEITEKFSAGIELSGPEVKSVRHKKALLDGAYAVVRGGEAYLIGATIPAYQEKNSPESYDPQRNRRLLLTKKEIQEITNLTDTKGLTAIAIELYNNGKLIKLSLGIGKGKRKTDKRATIQKRETDRDIRRTLKGEY